MAHTMIAAARQLAAAHTVLIVTDFKAAVLRPRGMACHDPF